MIQANELRIGNYIQFESGTIYPVDIVYKDYTMLKHWYPIPLTEEMLLKCGFSVINESSAGKRYGYVINGVFSSDLTFTFWKTTKEAGKFFRGDLELKSVHQLQNIYFALNNQELNISL